MAGTDGRIRPDIVDAWVNEISIFLIKMTEERKTVRIIVEICPELG